MLKGSIVALVTPMTPEGTLDQSTFLELLDWHLRSGTDAVVIAGSTGEGATLTPEERSELLRMAVGHVAGRIPVLASTGTQSTAQTLALTQEAKACGADAALVVTPFYNKPTQEGLYEHFKAVAGLGLPIVLYNVPSRTACDMLTETVIALSQIPGIIGIKEASSLSRCQLLIEQLPPSFKVFTGEDAQALSALQAGAAGVISVAANIIPEAMHQLMQVEYAQTPQAEALHQKFLPLFEALFWESNPIPVKWILGERGRIHPHLRLPLTPLNPQLHEPMRHVLKQCGVIG